MASYIIDTNIILDSPSNIHLLLDNNTNTVIIPDIVLDEVDSKKSGFDDINFNARAFARLLEDSVIQTTSTTNEVRVVELFVPQLNTILQVISTESYPNMEHLATMPASLINDRKILELARLYNERIGVATIISLDTMLRIRASSNSLPATALNRGNTDLATFDFHKSITIPTPTSLENIPVTSIDPDYHQGIYSYSIIDEHTGAETLCNVANGRIQPIDNANLGRQAVSPVNKEQKFFVDAILSDYYKIVSADAKAGSGKTLLSLATAMRLVSQKRYNSIVYVRNSIESLAKGEEVGFLPGLDEKFRIYNHPLYDSLRFIARTALTRSNANKSKANATTISEEAISTKVEELVEQYNIQTMWVGEMRGRTISDAIVIVDEFQNCSASTGQLILSRLDSNCKAICIGSNKQIDNMYTNKYINALTCVLKATLKEQNVPMFSCNLSKVVRGPITELAESIFN